MKNYKINTTKKRIALEVIFLVVVTFVCGILFFIKEYNDKEVDVIDLKIDSLNDTYFKRRFEALDIKQELEEYSYESYKKNILNDTDSSFRKKIYNSLCSAFRYYENEKTFNEFINDFEYDSINLKDIEISILERKKNEIKDQISNTNKLCNTTFNSNISFEISFLFNKMGNKNIRGKRNPQGNIFSETRNNPIR